MPFFNHSMAQSVRQANNLNLNETKGFSTPYRIRSMPGITETGRKTISKATDPSIVNNYTQQVQQRKLLFTRSLLKSQIEQIKEQNGALSINQAKQVWDNYQIDYNNVLHTSEEVRMYSASCKLAKEFPMMAIVYSTKTFNPQSSFYLKLLRHLGRKHPYIILTWEIFHDDTNIYVFQELVTKGNLVIYMENNIPSESQVCFWAKQMYRALDFLGDNGIAHREITPIHIVIKPMGNELWIKLTGFRRSIIYWNTDTNDINFCQCLPVAQQKQDGPNFQAPEVYGNVNEVFDPIQADIWSYGAVLFFCLANFYPYNIDYPHEDLDEEIIHNISKISCSNECKNFLTSLLKSNANDRIPFDFIDHDPWIKKLS